VKEYEEYSDSDESEESKGLFIIRGEAWRKEERKE
jgi:hypothetical protein